MLTNGIDFNQEGAARATNGFWTGGRKKDWTGGNRDLDVSNGLGQPGRARL